MGLNKHEKRLHDRLLAFAIHRLDYKNGQLPVDFIYKYINQDIPKEKLKELYHEYQNARTAQGANQS